MDEHVRIEQESLADARQSGNVEELLYRHWQEIAHFPDIPLCVKWEDYEAHEAAGKLRIFTVRDRRELVGYACYAVGTAPHYASSVQAVQDVLFLAPEYRRFSIGRRLVSQADRTLAAEGVQATYQHSKVAHPIDALLKREGYEIVETIWAKRHDRRK